MQCFFALSLLFLFLVHGLETQLVTFPFLMPDIEPIQKDTHLCVAVQLSQLPFQSGSIVEFTPRWTEGAEHHMQIDGCQAPGYYDTNQPNVVWNCDHDPDSVPAGFPKASKCAPGMKSELFYLLQRGINETLKMPPGVGFAFGGDTGINFLVLKIHYEFVKEFLSKNGNHSKSSSGHPGVILTMNPVTPDTRRAGILVLSARGRIAPHNTAHLETALRIDEPVILHPFGFQVHTHKMGTAVSGWKAGADGKWSLIGKLNPQLTEIYRPVVDSNMTIGLADVIAARCTIRNPLPRFLSASAPDFEEMCTFRVMYYANGDQLPAHNTIETAGTPDYYWQTDEALPDGLPNVDFEASSMPE